MALEPQGNDHSDEEPLVAPSLPPPSKAVQRVRRGKVSVDIWASTEEVEYERRANQIDLEADDIGAVAPKEKSKHKKKAKKPPLEIYYCDRMGHIQGPYPKAQMQNWYAAGFFPPTTMVKTNRNDAWIPVGNLPALQPESNKDTMDRNTEVANDESDDHSLQARIAALKSKETTVEDRIAALKQQNQVVDTPSDEQTSAIQDRIAALRASQRSDIHEDTSVPPPPPPSREAVSHEYPVHNDHPPHISNDNANMSPPPSYPLDEDDEDVHGMPPYPAVESPPPYPLDDEEDEAYPVDEEYPITASYPLPEDDGGDVAYPVTEAYPVIDEYPETADDNNCNDLPTPAVQDTDAPVYPVPPPPSQTDPPKKVVKVDKEVVALLPSHLHHRKKRKPTSPTPPPPKKLKQVVTTAPPPKDDYDKFMEEIEGIGEGE